MKLENLIDCIKSQVLSISVPTALKSNYRSVTIKDLFLNSKLVKKGGLFFCLSGSRHKGSDFINEAYQRGARVIIQEEEIKAEQQTKLIIIRVKDVISCLGIIADKFYGHLLDKLRSIAVTGTNGKTSITFIIENILKEYKKQAGVIGTINYRFPGSKIDAKNTTPDILTIYGLTNRMLKKNIRYLLMEVSSHALDQRRVEGIKFDQAIFTNLTQDHFDYHKTKQKYFQAKSKLFTDYLKSKGVAILNSDDVYGVKLTGLLKRKHKNILTYGINNKADIKADNLSLKSTGSSFTVSYKKQILNINTNLIGRFNVYNILAAVASCLALNIPKELIIEGVSSLYVPGRLEQIKCTHNVGIFVDYAHTEDALRNVLFTLRDLKGSGRLIVVFGCGGNRDKDKRHKMGKVASALADFIILTSDNPRFENAKDIISDIEEGIGSKKYEILIDRRQAIEKAIDIAKSGDIIVVAGKGHEDYQIIKDKKIPFNDCKVIEEILSQKELAGV